MQLYNYFRSSASFRVRIALNLKGLPFEYISIHLPKNEHQTEQFRSLSPDALVPVLVEGSQHMNQSLAICEYLEEAHPEPRILPIDLRDRARVRSLAYMVACEIHPLNNLRVLRYLVNDLGVTGDAKDQWYKHWVEQGLTAFEAALKDSPESGRFCHGDAPTLADICLVPQIFNAQRFNCNLTGVPTVMGIFERCMQIEAFERAAPANQPDAQ